MSPGRTLIEIEAAKTELREAIRCRRAVVAEAGTGIAGALGWVDLALALWRRLPLLAKVVPVLTALFAAGRVGRRTSRVRSWLALLTAALRLFRSVRARGGPAQPAARGRSEHAPVVPAPS